MELRRLGGRTGRKLEVLETRIKGQAEKGGVAATSIIESRKLEVLETIG